MRPTRVDGVFNSVNPDGIRPESFGRPRQEAAECNFILKPIGA